ncbi:MAG: hypothetical protein COW85_05555 [Ignavibacteria bacterium CG22_combo_CG10-13_8_21_14_all_37_15]|nr:MAG: hypothetical protein COW85_05555 [Ignavibacteria bacterium CG22_combo_CG10-13_8_21_14_all_37_15]
MDECFSFNHSSLLIWFWFVRVSFFLFSFLSKTTLKLRRGFVAVNLRWVQAYNPNFIFFQYLFSLI